MIEKLIGYAFKNKDLLKQSLTHPSFSSSNFQAMEFLGDRVLGMVIADIVFKKEKNVKHIAHAFSNLVNTSALVEIAKNWRLGQYLKHNIEFISNKVLADAVEAIVAAIYLDSDWATVYKIVKKQYFSTLKPCQLDLEPKMCLQELSQKQIGSLPIYELVNIEGQDHKKTYTISVSVNGLGSATGKGMSKKEASKAAAQNLVNIINEKS